MTGTALANKTANHREASDATSRGTSLWKDCAESGPTTGVGCLDLVVLLVMAAVAAGFLYVLFVVVIIVEAFRATRRRQSSTPSGYEQNYRSLL